MTYNKKIDVQILSEKSDNIGNQVEEWQSLSDSHIWAFVNGTGGREYYSARAVNSENDVTFRIRYSRIIAEYRTKTEKIRIIYDGNIYDIMHIDDYCEQHRELVIKGRAINEKSPISQGF